MGWAFPYPTTSLEFFLSQPLIPKIFFSLIKEEGFLVLETRMGYQNIIWEIISLVLPHTRGQAKSSDGIFLGWEFPSLQGGGSVQTSDSTAQCSKTEYSDLILLLDFTLLYPVFSPCSPKKSLDSLPIPKGANWQADVLQKGYCSQNTAVLFWIKSCGALFILEYFYFLCTTYNHVLLTEIYFKEKKKKIWKYSLKKIHKNLY